MLIGKSMYSTVSVISHRPALRCNRIYKALPLAQIFGRTVSNWLINLITTIDQNVRYRSRQQVGQNNQITKLEKTHFQKWACFQKWVLCISFQQSDERRVMHCGCEQQSLLPPLLTLLPGPQLSDRLFSAESPGASSAPTDSPTKL